MGLFVKDTDFNKGEIRIATSTATQVDLNIFIDTAEVEVLQELFGFELYELFVADLVDGVPQTQRFIDVFDAFYDDTDAVAGWCCGSSRSEGIKKMLMRFIYFEFTREQHIQNTSTGPIKPDRNNAISATGPEIGLITKYNKGVGSYQAIARKMILDRTTYPEYKGISKSKTISI
jgi:hypothetical protein